MKRKQRVGSADFFKSFFDQKTRRRACLSTEQKQNFFVFFHGEESAEENLFRCERRWIGAAFFLYWQFYIRGT